MSAALYGWFETAHIFGAILWISGLIACLRLLQAHAAGGGEAAAQTAHSTALLMDLGAAVAIGAGLTMALGVTPSAFSDGGWLHAKLTVVVLGVLSAHGITRAKVGKARRGEQVAIPGFLVPLAIALPAVIVALAVTKPL
jgi:protoporphyrinogen IX oxidase